MRRISACFLALLAALLGRPALAQGVALERFTVEATAEPAPSQGVWLLPVPAELRSLAESEDGGEMVVVDANGHAVPAAWARGRGPEQDVPLRAQAAWPRDPVTYAAVDRPIDGLHVRLSWRNEIAQVTVEEQRGSGEAAEWVPLVKDARVWRHELGTHTDVPLPPTRGPLRVSVRTLDGDFLARAAGVSAYRRQAPDLAPHALELPVVETRVEESGWARYVVELPGPLPVDAVEVHAQGDVFDRAVAVTRSPLVPGAAPRATGRLRRVQLGGAALDDVTVRTIGAPGPADPADQLILYVESKGRPALEITGVTVHIEAVGAVLRDPPAGPLRLMGGGEPGAAPTHDLQLAMPELGRMLQGTLSVGPVQPNPGYRPPEVRSGLTDAAAQNSGAHTSQRVIQGSGLVRLRVPPEVAAEAQPDLADLRVVDAQGHLVPHLLQRRAAGALWPDVQTERTEHDGTSRITVDLPGPGQRPTSLRLTTSQEVFQREVRVYRARGANLEPLRSVTWTSRDRPRSLTLHLDGVQANRLVVEVHNGDDAPLPLDPVEVRRAQWDVITTVPEGGAWLASGDPALGPAHYDLALLRSGVLRRATGRASLGPAERAPEAVVSASDRAAVLVGIGALVVGLLFVTLRVVRRVPAGMEAVEA